VRPAPRLVSRRLGRDTAQRKRGGEGREDPNSPMPAWEGMPGLLRNPNPADAPTAAGAARHRGLGHSPIEKARPRAEGAALQAPKGKKTTQARLRRHIRRQPEPISRKAKASAPGVDNPGESPRSNRRPGAPQRREGGWAARKPGPRSPHRPWRQGKAASGPRPPPTGAGPVRQPSAAGVRRTAPAGDIPHRETPGR